MYTGTATGFTVAAPDTKVARLPNDHRALCLCFSPLRQLLCPPSPGAFPVSKTVLENGRKPALCALSVENIGRSRLGANVYNQSPRKRSWGGRRKIGDWTEEKELALWSGETDLGKRDWTRTYIRVCMCTVVGSAQVE